MTIQSIHIKGFKSIRDQSVELRPINILIGPNGAGKSNFINLFRMFNRMVEKDFQTHVRGSGGAEKFLHFGSKVTGTLVISITFEPNFYRCVLAPGDPDILFFKDEVCGFRSDSDEIHEYSTRMPAQLETGLIGSKYPVAGWTLHYMEGWKVYHFHDTSDSALVKKTARIADNRSLNPDASNLAAMLYFCRVHHPRNYQDILETVQQVAPFLRDFDLEPEPANPETIRLRWKHTGTDAYFDASDLSDGTLRFICLCTLFMQPKPPSTILLDEPELGLHPHAIHLLAGIMQQASATSQIIASTQSVTLANQFTFEDVIVVDREGDESVFHRYGAEEYKAWTEDYGLGDLWEKNLLGGTP